MSLLSPDRQSEFRARLCSFEGRIPWLYLDGDGNPTAGIGHECATVEAALALGFSAAEWAAVRLAAPGHSAVYYANLSTHRMTVAQMEAVLDADIAEKERELLRWVPDVVNFPEAIRTALLDFAYNPGPHRLVLPAPSGWPHMMASIRAGDYATAAEESHRNGIQPARNEYVAGLIHSAGVPV